MATQTVRAGPGASPRILAGRLMADYEEILEQHASIVTHLERLETLVEDHRSRLRPAQKRQLLRQHLAALREVLVPHFAAEEEGGYLHEIVEARPDLEHRTASLGAQHGEILDHIGLTLGSVADKGLPSLFEDAKGTIERLRAHEAAERALIQDAALRELSAAD